MASQSDDRETTFDVRVWSVNKTPSTRKGAKKGDVAYRLRWSVAGRTRSATFPTAALAESKRAELLSATRRGEAFDVETGLPLSTVPAAQAVTDSWWQWALVYVDLKWPTLAPNSRLSLAEALTTATMALLVDERGRPPAVELRRAMMQWAFVTSRRAVAGEPPAEHERAVRWLASHTRPLSALGDSVVVRGVLDALARTLAGRPAAATTVARKRAVLFNALELAVEQGRLEANPIPRIRWRAPKAAGRVDPACVVNVAQARALLAAVARVGDGTRTGPDGPIREPDGGRLQAFFACMYYAGMRPSEALALVESDLQLPRADQPDAWGQILLSRNDPEVAATWTDRGRREAGPLKHRARGEVRPVPCSPALVAHLRKHLERYPPAADGRLFRGGRGGLVKESVYSDVWKAARERALTPAQVASPLAARPYDLRHSCVSTWLAAGVDPVQIAEWVGHSVAVLHRVYAHVLPGRDDVARGRIDALFDDRRDS